MIRYIIFINGFKKPLVVWRLFTKLNIKILGRDFVINPNHVKYSFLGKYVYLTNFCSKSFTFDFKVGGGLSHG